MLEEIQKVHSKIFKHFSAFREIFPSAKNNIVEVLIEAVSLQVYDIYPRIEIQFNLNSTHVDQRVLHQIRQHLSKHRRRDHSTIEAQDVLIDDQQHRPGAARAYGDEQHAQLSARQEEL